MKRIDNFLLKQTLYGQLWVDGRTFAEMLGAAGFRAGDLISVVVTSDLGENAEIEQAVSRLVKTIVGGQRRRFSLHPESVFTVMEIDPGLSNYWRVKFDGPLGREATYGEEYIARRSVIELAAMSPTPASVPPPPLQWWICQTNQSYHGQSRRVLARTPEEAQSLANSEPGCGCGYYCIVTPLGQ